MLLRVDEERGHTALCGGVRRERFFSGRSFVMVLLERIIWSCIMLLEFREGMMSSVSGRTDLWCILPLRPTTTHESRS